MKSVVKTKQQIDICMFTDGFLSNKIHLQMVKCQFTDNYNIEGPLRNPSP